MYQFDLQANDSSATQTLIATWDGYVNPYPTIFFLEALAPDGKIYIASTSSTQNLHVIHRPNCPGLSCNLEQHGVDLPGYNYISVPNFPQYVQSNLTAGCDTLTNTVISQNKSTSLLVFPNPVSEILYLQTDNYKNAWQLINQLGQVVLSGKELPESIDCSRLPPAVYFLRVGGNRTSVVKW